MTTSTLTRRAMLALLGGAAAAGAVASPAIAEKLNVNNNGLAIQGYDPVAYFTQDAAIEGSAEFTATHQGATYQFTSADNRDLFAADPAKYAPAYGGFCAYAVANGYTAKVDPAAYSVVDGKLYLNYSKGVRSRWQNDVAGNISKGDANWPSLSQ